MNSYNSQYLINPRYDNGSNSPMRYNPHRISISQANIPYTYNLESTKNSSVANQMEYQKRKNYLDYLKAQMLEKDMQKIKEKQLRITEERADLTSLELRNNIHTGNYNKSEIHQSELRAINSDPELRRMKEENNKILNEILLIQAGLKNSLKKEEKLKKNEEDRLDDLRIQRERAEIAEEFKREQEKKLLIMEKYRNVDEINKEMMEEKKRQKLLHKFDYYPEESYNWRRRLNKNLSTCKNTDQIWENVGGLFHSSIVCQVDNLKYHIKGTYGTLHDEVQKTREDLEFDKNNHIKEKQKNKLKEINERVAGKSSKTFDDLERKCNEVIIDVCNNNTNKNRSFKKPRKINMDRELQNGLDLTPINRGYREVEVDNDFPVTKSLIKPTKKETYSLSSLGKIRLSQLP